MGLWTAHVDALSAKIVLSDEGMSYRRGVDMVVYDTTYQLCEVISSQSGRDRCPTCQL